MKKAALAAAALARPPLTAVPERLRILADEMPEGVTGAMVVLYPDNVIYMFGTIDNTTLAAGVLFQAATTVASPDSSRGSD